MRRLYIVIRSFMLSLLDKVTLNKGTWTSIHGSSLRFPFRYRNYYPPGYEKENFVFISSIVMKKGYCIDVGAHLGIYSLWLAKSKSRDVIAFEPTPDLYETCIQIIRLNGLETKIQLFRKAVSDTNGKADFILYNKLHRPGSEPSRLAEANSLEKFDHGHGTEIQKTEVECITIDTIREKHGKPIAFIKIDAEGSEYSILQGAFKTFEIDRPHAVISIHSFMYPQPEQTLTGIFNFFDAKGYHLLHNTKRVDKDQLIALRSREIFDIQLIPQKEEG